MEEAFALNQGVFALDQGTFAPNKGIFTFDQGMFALNEEVFSLDLTPIHQWKANGRGGTGGPGRGLCPRSRSDSGRDRGDRSHGPSA